VMLIFKAALFLWPKDPFSDQEIINFTWFKNMIYVMMTGFIFKEHSNLISFIWDLDFNPDWYWNLGIIVIILYVSIWRYSQVQSSSIAFYKIIPPNQKKDYDLAISYLKIEGLMLDQKACLGRPLSLKTKTRTNPSVLSVAINQNFDKNFNDFVNEYRIYKFLEKSTNPDFKYSALLATDSGFNSKSIFNRSSKKIISAAPSSLDVL
jgi:AraC-like DNA-binding protein